MSESARQLSVNGDDLVLDVVVEQIAVRVVELLRGERTGHAHLVDARTVAEAIGMSAEFVRDHADELGGRRCGDGPRPRLRFDLAVVLEAWNARPASVRSQPSERPKPSGKRAARRASSVPLLPIGRPNQGRNGGRRAV